MTSGTRLSPGRVRLSAAATATALVGLGMVVASPAPAAAAGATYYVSTTGSDGGSGSSTSPFKTVQRAANVARPGDQILVRKGTYSGQVRIDTSGTAAAPITLKSAGDGVVTLTTSFPMPACSANSAMGDRTLLVEEGADYWTITGLTIVGGVRVKGDNGPMAFDYLNRYVEAGDWQTRRAVPGRGTNDPVAARNAFSYISQRIGTTINPSDGIKLINNKISKVGVQVIASRYGEFSNNDVGPIACGTGPGLWVNVYSDGWKINANRVHDIAASSYKHWMQEGIRIGAASSYNTVTNNVVERLPGDGRAINTDTDPSWNLISRNRANDVAIGFNDQMAGWGNRWEYNTVTNFRVNGLNFRAKDSSLTRPSLNSSTYKTIVKCNVAMVGTGVGLNIGAVKSSTFINNSVKSVSLGKYVAGYWAAEGNTWNGTTKPPPAKPPVPPASAC